MFSTTFYFPTEALEKFGVFIKFKPVSSSFCHALKECSKSFQQLLYVQSHTRRSLIKVWFLTPSGAQGYVVFKKISLHLFGSDLHAALSALSQLYLQTFSLRTLYVLCTTEKELEILLLAVKCFQNKAHPLTRILLHEPGRPLRAGAGWLTPSCEFEES